MTDKELKKLRRGELLEILVAQQRENESLKKHIKKLEAEVQDRRIVLEQAGSIAEAALQLNGVFEAAQAAAQQYLDNIQRLSHEASEREPRDEENLSTELQED